MNKDSLINFWFRRKKELKVELCTSWVCGSRPQCALCDANPTRRYEMKKTALAAIERTESQSNKPKPTGEQP